MRRNPARTPLRILLNLLLTVALGLAGSAARAQGVELTSLEVSRTETGLALEYSARLTLSHAIEDALMRRAIKVAAVDYLCRQIECVVVDENRAEHRTLRLEVMRQRTLCGSNCSVNH